MVSVSELTICAVVIWPFGRRIFGALMAMSASPLTGVVAELNVSVPETPSGTELAFVPSTATPVTVSVCVTPPPETAVS